MERVRPKSVKPLFNYLIEVEFSNGETRKFDCKPYLNGDWFSELLDINVFNTVRVSGNTVEWAGGQDLCPDCLYENSFQ